MSVSRVCLGYTSYRLETLPYVRRKMQEYQCIVLEEPPTPGFSEMLGREMATDSYLMLTDFGFPLFAREQCSILQELHFRGKTILQVEPFLQELIGIHEFFAAEGTPQQIPQGTITRQVYDCERAWTSRLLAFYKATGNARDFSAMVDAVKDFARVDAEKGRLRDTMRARALQELFGIYSSMYVEAGYIHFVLLKEMRNRLPASATLNIYYTLQDYFRAETGRRQLLGPGDILTLLYTWKPDYSGPKTDILAAQSLIYNKIVHKEEFQKNLEDLPHARNEIQAVNLARSLDYDQCAGLYDRIKGFSTQKALEEAQGWLQSTRH